MKVRKERIEKKATKTVIKKYIEFYNKNLRKKHLIIYIISLVIFAFFMTDFISNKTSIEELLKTVDSGKTQVDAFGGVFSNKIPVATLIAISGFTPFIYLPVIGIIGFPYMIVENIMLNAASNLVVQVIFGIIQIFGSSLAVAIGMYICTNYTKKFRYSQSNSLGLDDVKAQIYEIKKDEKSLNNLKEKVKIKNEKKEKLNVKIDYLSVCITLVISICIIAISSIISGV